MIRLIILCIILFLLYMGFNLASSFDAALKITVLDYHISTTFFTFIAIFFIIQLFLVLVLKAAFGVLGLPFMLKVKWHEHKFRKASENLLKAVGDMIMGNRQRSLQLILKLIPEVDKNNKELSSLVVAELEENIDVKVQNLRNLLDKKHYSVYAAKTLARIFFDKNEYKIAASYATKAFNETDTDPDLMLILIRIYAKTGSWSQMVFVISKLQRADIKLLEQHGEELAHYYYLAAKSELAASNDTEALKFLELSLEMQPDYLYSLNLFTELSVNMNNSTSVLKLLKTAFSNCPSFEIAELYIKCSRSSGHVIYGTLAGLAKPSEHYPLFLAIAAYLGLNDKITEIKEPKLIGSS